MGKKRIRQERAKKIIFVLKAVSVLLLVSIALYMILHTSMAAAADIVGSFVLAGLLMLGLLTAIVFLSGDAYPKSLWGRLELARRKRLKNDQRFRMERIVIAELWLTYFIISCFALRNFFFLEAGLIGKSVIAVLFVIFTFTILILVILISHSVKPRSFWGRMSRFLK